MPSIKRINFVENNLLRVLTREIQEELAESKLERIYPLKVQGYAFAMSTRRGPRYLVCSLHPSLPALYVSEDPPNMDKERTTPYDHHLKKARFSAINQLNRDRLIRIEWEIINPVLGRTQLTMFVEFLGSFCNLILIGQDQKILGFARGQTPDDKQCRLIAKGAVYESPGPPLAYHVSDMQEPAFMKLFSQASSNKPLWKFFVMNLTGLSPQYAQEAIVRAELPVDLIASELDSSQRKQVWQSLQKVLELCGSDSYEKFYLYQNPETDTPLAISLFPSRLFPDMEEQSFPNLNQATGNVHPSILSRFELDRKKSKILKQVNKKIKKASALRKSLQQDLEKAKNADQYRLWGELIKANMRNLPRGQLEIKVTNFYDPKNAPVTIKLDPKMDLHKNADSYFRIARKAEASKVFILKRIKMNNSELVKLTQLRDDVEARGSVEELEAMELSKDGKILVKKEEKRSKSRTPRLREYRISDGWRVFVGRNGKENDLLTHRLAEFSDLWFHAHGAHGSHVILRREGRKTDISWKAVEEAAAIAAWFSKARYSGKAPVDYTEVRYLRKPRGAAPGLVTYLQHRSIMVQPGLPPKYPLAEQDQEEKI
ncbi:MAG: hypothetical protein B6244_09885 [Candidatus Cloacimonetes bacterium 4572_55]|nr:MAG: hypothetical protein B6244_09885 [Candidatus Cloacimonetes bacterium 4572_55]